MLNSAPMVMSAPLPFLSVEAELMLPVSTFPVRLVMVILPPLLLLELELRLPV
jgi:hypothetical protein